MAITALNRLICCCCIDWPHLVPSSLNLINASMLFAVTIAEGRWLELVKSFLLFFFHFLAVFNACCEQWIKLYVSYLCFHLQNFIVLFRLLWESKRFVLRVLKKLQAYATYSEKEHGLVCVIGYKVYCLSPRIFIYEYLLFNWKGDFAYFIFSICTHNSRYWKFLVVKAAKRTSRLAQHIIIFISI